MLGAKLFLFAGVPSAFAETSVTTPLATFLTYTSSVGGGLGETKFEDAEANAIFDPSSEMLKPPPVPASALTPAAFVETSVSAPVPALAAGTASNVAHRPSNAMDGLSGN